MTERFSPILPSNLEIVHAALENRLILVAGDVFVQVLAAALRMAHLAEDTAIRLVMPSMARTEPLGLYFMSMLGLPF